MSCWSLQNPIPHVSLEQIEQLCVSHCALFSRTSTMIKSKGWGLHVLITNQITLTSWLSNESRGFLHSSSSLHKLFIPHSSRYLLFCFFPPRALLVWFPCALLRRALSMTFLFRFCSLLILCHLTSQLSNCVRCTKTFFTNRFRYIMFWNFWGARKAFSHLVPCFRSLSTKS